MLLVIFAESMEALIGALERLSKVSECLDLRVSWIKTKIQDFNDLLGTAISSVSVCGESVDLVERFTYLGSDIHVSGDSSYECNETSFFFEAPNKIACKHLWKCCVEYHTFFRMPENDSNTLSRKLTKFGSLGSKHRYSGKTALQMGKDSTLQLPRPDLQVPRARSKTYPKRTAQSSQQAGSNNVARTNTKTENQTAEGTTKIMAPSPVKSSKIIKQDSSPDAQNEKSTVPWDENGPQSGLYNSSNDRTKSPKFPNPRRRTPSGGSDNEAVQPPRRRSRQENEMVDSAPQWEAVLRRQKEKSQNDPNHRRSRHRSRSRSPDVQAKEELWKHIQKELVDPSGLTEEQLKEIPYKKVETQGDPIRIRHSHSPRSFRQYRRSQCSDGERSVLSEVNARTDLVPPLPVTRTADAQGTGGSLSQQTQIVSILINSMIPLPEYKAEGVVKDIPKRIVDYIRPGPYRLDWDSLMTTMDIVEKFDQQGCCIMRYMTAGQLWNIIAPREFVDFSYTTDYENGLLSCGVSVEHGESGRNCVRGFNHPCGWFCRPLEDNVNHSLLTGFIQTDLRGMLPQSVVDTAMASSLVGFYTDLRKALQM
ncbi:E41LA protein, partial [Polypterus senegalus]